MFLYFATPSYVVSRCSSNKTRLNFNVSSFFWGSNCSTLSEGRPISIGTIASNPKERENGVSPVDVWVVVQYAHSTFDSSFAHSLFNPSTFFFPGSALYFGLLLHLPISLRMSRKRAMMLDSKIWANFPKCSIVKLFSVISDYCIRNSKPTYNNLLLNEVGYFLFSFGPFCKIIHCYYCKSYLSFAFGKWSNEVYFPLCECPKTSSVSE